MGRREPAPSLTGKSPLKENRGLRYRVIKGKENHLSKTLGGGRERKLGEGKVMQQTWKHRGLPEKKRDF